MKKIGFVLGGLTLTSIVALYYLTPLLCLTTDNIINIGGFFLTLAGLLMIMFQLRIDLNQNKRQAAHDFIHGPITATLEPLERRLKELLGKEVLFFPPGETIIGYLRSDVGAKQNKEITSTVADILNFYERMAIGIFKQTLDEDVCYDDKGFAFLSFHRWVSDHIEHRRRDVGEDRIWANISGLARQWQNRYDRDVRRRPTHGTNGPAIVDGRPMV